VPPRNVNGVPGVPKGAQNANDHSPARLHPASPCGRSRRLPGGSDRAPARVL